MVTKTQKGQAEKRTVTAPVGALLPWGSSSGTRKGRNKTSNSQNGDVLMVRLWLGCRILLARKLNFKNLKETNFAFSSPFFQLRLSVH